MPLDPDLVLVDVVALTARWIAHVTPQNLRLLADQMVRSAVRLKVRSECGEPSSPHVVIHVMTSPSWVRVLGRQASQERRPTSWARRTAARRLLTSSFM